MTADLLNQLTAVIETAEINRVDAARWQNLLDLLSKLGYGPRVMPEQIAELVPNIRGLQELATATQEVVPAPAGSKFPRRKLTPEDEPVISDRFRNGLSAEQIADDLGIAQRSVVTFIDDRFNDERSV